MCLIVSPNLTGVADLANAKLEVALDLFGQETIVELSLSQIEKA